MPPPQTTVVATEGSSGVGDAGEGGRSASASGHEGTVTEEVPHEAEGASGSGSGSGSDDYVDVGAIQIEADAGAEATAAEGVEVAAGGDDEAAAPVDVTGGTGLRRRARREEGGEEGGTGPPPPPRGNDPADEGTISATAVAAASENATADVGQQVAVAATATEIPHPGRLPENIYDNGLRQVGDNSCIEAYGRLLGGGGRGRGDPTFTCCKWLIKKTGAMKKM